MLTLLVLLVAAAPATAAPQRIDERLRGQFARAETLFRAGETAASIAPLSAVIDALERASASAALDNEGRALMIRSLAYRADANLAEGSASAADDDLETLINRFPRVAIDGFSLSDAVTGRFARARERLIGTMTFVLDPIDTRVRLDGAEIPAGTTIYEALAGPHLVEAFLPGFTRQVVEVDVRAGRNQEVSFALERVSAVIKLLTRPAGATVLVDGNVVGETSGVAPRDWTPSGDAAGYPPREFSSEMEIEGLMPGEHEVEVMLDGYRSFRAPVTIPDLADYRVGGIVLTRNLGLVLLRDLSAAAEVWVDGRRAQPEPPSRAAGADDEMASTAYRLALPPGQYRITISEGDAGVFEETVTVADRRNVALSVRLRPALTFLGIAGADRVGAASLEATLSGVFEAQSYWAFLDRSQEAPTTLERSGASAESLRRAAEAGPSATIDWQRLQATIGREMPGSVFILGVLAQDQLADEADLWVWPAAPGPARPERIRVSLTDPRQIDALGRRLSAPMAFARPWLGLQLIDSTVSAGPIIAGIAPDSPAAAAGFRMSEQVVAVAGNPVAAVADVTSWLATFPAGSNVAIAVRGPAGERNVDVRLGSGPLIVAPSDSQRLFSVVWGMAAAAAGRLDAEVPSWISEMNQAAVLLHAREWDAAAGLLQQIQAPTGAGVGQGLVEYWTGLALARGGDVDGARRAFERVLAHPGARYLDNDGPFLAPMARARLAALAR